MPGNDAFIQYELGEPGSFGPNLAQIFQSHTPAGAEAQARREAPFDPGRVWQLPADVGRWGFGRFRTMWFMHQMQAGVGYTLRAVGSFQPSPSFPPSCAVIPGVPPQHFVPFFHWLQAQSFPPWLLSSRRAAPPPHCTQCPHFLWNRSWETESGRGAEHRAQGHLSQPGLLCIPCSPGIPAAWELWEPEILPALGEELGLEEHRVVQGVHRQVCMRAVVSQSWI